MATELTLIPHMPNGTPAPYMMTCGEVCLFLRLDATDQHDAVARLKTHGLAGVRMGNRILFLLPEVLRFISAKADIHPG